jgi:hypothetical protein
MAVIFETNRINTILADFRRNGPQVKNEAKIEINTFFAGKFTLEFSAINALTEIFRPIIKRNVA